MYSVIIIYTQEACGSKPKDFSTEQAAREFAQSETKLGQEVYVNKGDKWVFYYQFDFYADKIQCTEV